ncbi:Hint domain-containing protein [Pararhodobacter sp.]|uniref:Hint domain-containing protein n=1 Tax=Pararhodobacter sp. TaxID=2127056 RepID=UPI002AFECE50|nr:Hint domain-containing protein [Pararhodobacter sp.]
MPPRDDIPFIPPPTGPGVVDGTDGDDTIYSGYIDADGDRFAPGGSVVDAGSGDDNVHAGGGDDTIWGGTGDDYISGEQGDDILIGGAGHDVFSGGDGDNLIFGDSPDGDLGGNSPSDAPEPDFGDDHIYLDSGNDTFFGGSGNDTIYVGDEIGDSVFIGGETGEVRGDVIYGGWSESMSLLYTGDEKGIITQGDGSITFSEVEEVNLSYTDDVAEVLTSTSGHLSGWGGYDVLILPDPESGEAAPVVTITHETHGTGSHGATSKSGYVDFPDGNRLTFDTIEEIICFAAGTLIDTDHGPIPVEDLTPGDRVLTRDHGYQPLIWTGRRDLSAAEIAACPRAAPIRIVKGAMGGGLPRRDLIVSPRHRMLVSGLNTDLMFGEREVLVTAEDLLGLAGVTRLPSAGISYTHVMCDAHQIIRAEGAWTESFQPSDVVLGALDATTRAELQRLFPMLTSEAGQRAFASSRPVLNAAETGALFAARVLSSLRAPQHTI